MIIFRAGAMAAAVFFGLLATAGAVIAESSATKTLRHGIAAHRSGANDKAIRHLTDVITAQKRTTEELARAFYYRAKAYRAIKQPASALSDIQSAIWLNRLPRRERAELAKLKRRAIQEAGLPAPAKLEKSTLPPPRASEPSRAKPKRRAARTTRPTTQPQRAPKTARLEPWERTGQKARTTAAKATAPRGVPKISWSQPSVRRAATTQPAVRRTIVPPTRQRTARKPVITPWSTTHLPRRKAQRPPQPKPARPASPVIHAFKTTTQAAPKRTVAAKRVTTASIAPAQPARTAGEAPLPTARRTIQPPPSTDEARPAQPIAATASIPIVDSFMALSGIKKTTSPLDDWRAEADQRARERQEKIRRHNASLQPDTGN